MGESARAVPDLEIYLAQANDALDLDSIAERVAQLRRTPN